MKSWQKLKNNPHLWQQYFIREKVIAATREFFTLRKFHEVELPLLAPALPAESYLEIFETTLLDRHRKPQRAFLTTSPEMFLKKLLVAGIGDCFSLTKSFRNTETLSKTHNPEFTILEWYEVDKDYKDVMKTTEELFCYIHDKFYSSSDDPSADGDESRSNVIPAKAGIHLNRFPVKLGMTKSVSSRLRSNNKYTMTYQGQTIDLTPPWERISMVEAFKKYAQINLEKALTLGEISRVAKQKGYRIETKTTWEELFNQIYLNEVEKHLGVGKPTIIYDFPSQMAALAKKKGSDPRFAERFEIYICGLELGDCYSELTDWKEQEKRFISENKERKRLGKIAYPYDKDLITALKSGLPRSSGLALGVDRVVMLFADVPNIAGTLFFPAGEMWEKN